MRYQLDLTLRQAEGALARVLGTAERRGFRPLSVDGEAQPDGDRWYLRLTVEGERSDEPPAAASSRSSTTASRWRCRHVNERTASRTAANARSAALRMPRLSIAGRRTPSRHHTPSCGSTVSCASADALQAPLTTHAHALRQRRVRGHPQLRHARRRGSVPPARAPAAHAPGAELLGMDVRPPERASRPTLQTLRANRHRDAYIRPLAWFGTGSFGLDVAGRRRAPDGRDHADAGAPGRLRARIDVSPWRRNPADSLPPLKLCGALRQFDPRQARDQARGFDEALFVDAHGDVVECTGANVFLVQRRPRDRGRAPRRAARHHSRHADRADRRAVARGDARTNCSTPTRSSPAAPLPRWRRSPRSTDRDYGDNPVTRELSALYARVVRGEEASRACRLADAGLSRWIRAVADAIDTSPPPTCWRRRHGCAATCRHPDCTTPSASAAG